MKTLLLRWPRRHRWRSWLLVCGAIAALVPFILMGKLETKGAIYQGPADRQQVAFACNVFWGEEFIPGMLETLKSENVKMTFFIGGTWAQKHPELLKTIAGAGHELGNHSLTHPHPSALSLEQNQKQILQTERIIREVTGLTTRLYAPPYGEINSLVIEAATTLSYKTIMWSIDTIDWQRPPVDKIKHRIFKKLHNGAIILIHPTEPTARALPEIIRELKQRGYKIVTVSELIDG